MKMFLIYFIGGLALIGAALGFASGYLGVPVPGIRKVLGQGLFKVYGGILLIDIVVFVAMSLFSKRR